MGLEPNDDPDLSREYDGFEWDDAKNEKIAKRGFDFEFAARIFAVTHVLREDLRKDYDERRFVVTGIVEGVYVARNEERDQCLPPGNPTPSWGVAA